MMQLLLRLQESRTVQHGVLMERCVNLPNSSRKTFGLVILDDIQLDDNTPSWKKNFEKNGKKQSPAQRKEDRKVAFETAYSALNDGIQPVTQEDMCEYLGISSRTFKRRLEEIDGYKLDGNLVIEES